MTILGTILGTDLHINNISQYIILDVMIGKINLGGVVQFITFNVVLLQWCFMEIKFTLSVKCKFELSKQSNSSAVLLTRGEPQFQPFSCSPLTRK